MQRLRDIFNELWPEPTWEAGDEDHACPRCGASAMPESVTAEGCVRCRGQRLAWQRFVRLGAYHDGLDAPIREMKFDKQWAWARRFGEALAEAVPQPFDESKTVVCPVPMHWRRRWGRGFNQASLIANALGQHRGWPVVAALSRPRYTAPQSGLPISQRRVNVRGSFAIRWIDLRGYEVVLVDDVKTTGATLSACAELLRDAGARSITAAVAAVADPKNQRFEAV